MQSRKVYMLFFAVCASLHAMHRTTKTPPPQKILGTIIEETEESTVTTSPTKTQSLATPLTTYVFLGVKSELPHGALAQAVYESVDRENKLLPPLSPFAIDIQISGKNLQRIEFNRFEQRGVGTEKNYFKLSRIYFKDKKTHTVIKEMSIQELESGNFFYVVLQKPLSPTTVKPSIAPTISAAKPPRSPDSPSISGTHVRRQKRYSVSAPVSRTHSPESTATPPSSVPEFVSVVLPRTSEKPVERPAHAATIPTPSSHRLPIAPGDLATLPEPPPGDAR